jgi:predicted Rossmann fold flavoprotein
MMEKGGKAMQFAIIGGGAAGFAAAIAAAEKGARVTVLERGKKPLKKLGVAGNGRGNILNAGEPAYYGDAAFALAVLRRFGFPELKKFFSSLGAPLREEGGGWVYPASLQASAVQDALLLRAAQLGVEIRCLARVESVARKQGGFLLCGSQGHMTEDNKLPKEEPFALRADKVLVACGGAAAPAHGTDGSAYGLLTAFGHRRTELFPALCALNVPKKRIQGLSGQRVRAGLSLMDAQGNVMHRSRGEALFAEDAVSGIAAMQLARFWHEGAELILDLRDELNMELDVLPFVQSLAAMRRDRPVSDLLTGAFAGPVSRWILREAGVRDIQSPIEAADPRILRAVADTIQGVRLPVVGTRGFAFAQVTAGGVETEDFDPATMESRLIPGLYAAGEILNVDGDCGGFNLMFAFAGGLLAGTEVGTVHQ